MARIFAPLLAALVALLALVAGASARPLTAIVTPTVGRPLAGPRVTTVTPTPFRPGGPVVTSSVTRATPFRPLVGPQTTTVVSTPGRPFMGPVVVGK